MADSRLAKWRQRCFTAGVNAPQSPCTTVCRIDDSSGWCLGCRRTLAEIADWPMLTPARQRAVLAELAERGSRTWPDDDNEAALQR